MDIELTTEDWVECVKDSIAVASEKGFRPPMSPEEGTWPMLAVFAILAEVSGQEFVDQHFPGRMFGTMGLMWKIGQTDADIRHGFESLACAVYEWLSIRVVESGITDEERIRAEVDMLLATLPRSSDEVS